MSKCNASPWFMVGVAYLAIIVLYINVYAIPPLTLTLIKDITITYFQAGLLTTVFMAALSISNIITGVLSDKISPKIIMSVGLFIGFFSSFIFAKTSYFGVMLLCRALIGWGTASITAPCIIYMISVLPSDQKALGISGHLASITFGSGLSLFITPLLVTVFHWKVLFYMYAAAGLGVLLLFIIYVREPKKIVSTQFKPQKSNSGSALILISAMLFIVYLQIGGNSTWLAPWLEEGCLYNPLKVGIGAMTFQMMGIPSSIVGGYLFNKYNNLFYLCTGGMLLSTINILYVVLEGSAFYLVLPVIILARWGSFMCVGPLISAASARVASHSVGKTVGIINSIFMGGVVVSSLLGGYLIELTGGYTLMWIIFSTVLVFSACILNPFLVREMAPLEPG
jgi:predicted MFS family arabinose efflux permease